MKRIYLDCAAATPVDKEVLKEMLPYFGDKFGNPSSTHSFGQEAIAAIDAARGKIAKLLNCDFSEIIFTGSATEANNLAIGGLVKGFLEDGHGLIRANRGMPFHIITTNIEHESVLEPLKELEKLGHKITYLKVNKNGFINVSDLEKNIKKNTIFVSVIYANNEIGTIQPIKEIGKLLEKINVKRKEVGLNKIYFHTDAVQALQFLECRPDWLKTDLMTFSGHKIYGPKGVGCLFVRKIGHIGLIRSIITGGGQEFGLRSGTENVPTIVGFAMAAELALKNREKTAAKLLKLRIELLNNIIKNNKGVRLNGSGINRLPNNINIMFPGLSNETLLLALDQKGIAISAGSACSSRALTASHVLMAIGLSEKQAKESVRITLGKYTSEKEIIKAADIINKMVKILKSI